MKIAFVDSNPKRLNRFRNIINEYYKSQNHTAEVDLYENSSDLIEK